MSRRGLLEAARERWWWPEYAIEADGTDDAPVWVEALGWVFALGLFYRAGIHIWTAVLANHLGDYDINPGLAREDVALRSPVAGLRGHPVDRHARILTCLAGLTALVLLQHLQLSGPPVAQTYTVLQAAVCVADPAAYLAERAHDHYRRTASESLAAPRQHSTTDD